MQTERKIRDLTGEEIAALWAFAQNEGRTWKAKLTDVYWFNARIWGGATYRDEGAILHALRNDPRWGHEGLALLTYAKLETLAEGQGLKDPAPELSPPAPKGWDKAETSTEDQPMSLETAARAAIAALSQNAVHACDVLAARRWLAAALCETEPTKPLRLIATNNRQGTRDRRIAGPSDAYSRRKAQKGRRHDDTEPYA